MQVSELTSRQAEILSIIRQQERVDVDQLASAYEVTTQTIRRDLNALCERGLATRTHGGARQAVSISNVDYNSRRQLASQAKAAIGQHAASLIPDNCSILINVGTTTEQVAAALQSHRNLVIISNNINIIHILSGSQSKELVLTGGTVRQTDGAIVGSSAVSMINQYKVDFAVIGCSAIDEDGTVLDFDPREVTVARAILQNARTKILVADRQKFDRSANVRICHIGEIDHLVVDQAPPPAFISEARSYDTQIHITSDSSTASPQPIDTSTSSKL